MKLSVVIPAYNEQKDIQWAIIDVINAFPRAEIIVVNDASTDRTLEILEALKKFYAFQSVHIKILTNAVNCGHGYSVVRGLRAATGDYILYIDADRQIDVYHYGVYLHSQDFDFVSGWRINRNDKPFRKIISFCLKMTNLIFHGYYIKDANCPFKVYKRLSLLPLLDELPTSYIIPIACLEVLARDHKLKTVTIKTAHKPYEGVRKGFLQALNFKTVKFFSNAFFEIVGI